MKKRILSFILTVVMLVTILVPTATAVEPITIEVTSDTDTVEIGGQFVLTVTLKQKVTGLAGLSLIIDYDETKLSSSSLTVGTMPGDLQDNPLASNRKVIFSWETDSPYGDDFGEDTSLFSVTFTVNNGTVGDNIAPVVVVDEDGDAFYNITWDILPSDVKNTTVNITAPTVSVTGVTLDKSALNLTVGDYYTLTAEVNPAEATDKTVTWSSSDTAVATVDNTGKVTAVAEGTANITVTTKDGEKTATCVVTVEEAPCTHEHVTEEPAVPSTCKDYGHNKYYICNDCHKVLKADKITETTVEAETLTTLADHTGGTATCTAKAKCTVCGMEYGELLAHVFTEKLEDDAHLVSAGDCQTYNLYCYDCENCDTKGTDIFTGTTLGEHKMDTEWTIDGDKHFHKCTVSGCTYVEDDAAHTGGTATCTAKAKCTVCGAEYGELAAHTYGSEWKSDETGHWHECVCGKKDAVAAHTPDRSAPTETEPVKCTVCDFIIDPATGHISHTPESGWTYNETEHWHKCVGCEEKLNVEAHTGGTATCIAKAVCEKCGAGYGDFAAHTGGTATCVAKAKCEVCGEEYGDYADHVDSDDDELCDICGCDMHEHTYPDAWSYDDKYHWHECACGDIDSKEEHTAGKWITDIHPTAVMDGLRHKECEVCGKIMETEAIPATTERDYDEIRWAIIMSQIRNKRNELKEKSKNVEKDEPVVKEPEVVVETPVAIDEDIIAMWENPFIDIFETDAYYSSIEFVYTNGLFNGVSATEFAPSKTMTRAMFVTVLGRLAGVDVTEYDSIDFDDVEAGEWYTPYVSWAASCGIVNGYGDGLFGINNEITVEQAAVIIARYADFVGIDVTSDYDLGEFTDGESVSDWAEDAMAWVVENGIYEAEGELAPQDKASRALVATLICNFADKYIY